MDSNGSAAAAAAPVAAVGSPVYSEPTLLDAFEDGNKALDKLKELEIGGALFEHQAATTVQEQLKALGSVTGVKTKNLFLKVRDEEQRQTGFLVVGGILLFRAVEMYFAGGTQVSSQGSGLLLCAVEAS